LTSRVIQKILEKESSMFLKSRKIGLLPSIGFALSLLACGTQPAEDSSVMAETQSTADTTCSSMLAASDKSGPNLESMNSCFNEKYGFDVKIIYHDLDSEKIVQSLKNLEAAYRESNWMKGKVGLTELWLSDRFYNTNPVNKAFPEIKWDAPISEITEFLNEVYDERLDYVRKLANLIRGHSMGETHQNQGYNGESVMYPSIDSAGSVDEELRRLEQMYGIETKKPSF
jgi:hypothetical protein